MRTAIVVMVLALAAVHQAAAQITVPGAGEDKFGLIAANDSVVLSTADDAVTLNWSTEGKYRTMGDCIGLRPNSDELRECMETRLSNTPLVFNFSLGVTGEKGKGKLLSKGLLNPGVTFSGGFNYRIEDAAGYYDIYGSAGASLTQLKVATLPAAGAASIDATAEKKFTASGGLNRFFNEHFAVGGSLSLTRALTTPGLNEAISLCKTTVGIAADGGLIEASDCNDGYLGPLPDQWVRSLRFDTLYNFNRYGWKDGNAVAVATLGVIASASIAGRTGTPATGNIAFGPVLHPKGIPHKALVALVIKYSDITNAVTGTKTKRERLGAVLWFGIPLKGL